MVFFSSHSKSEKILAWLTFLSVTTATFLVFVQAPLEKVMREVQKIFYFHVASAWIGMLAFVVVFFCSILYLVSKKQKWDIYAATSAEIGVVFTTIVLITGPIWAKAWWTKWWTWDPRLTSTLIMWFLYLAYGKIHSSLGEEGKRATYAAVFGILAFIDVPIVFFAIRIWNTMHPKVITANSTGLAPAMLPAFFSSLIAFTFLYIYLWTRSINIEHARNEVRNIKNNVLNY